MHLSSQTGFVSTLTLNVHTLGGVESGGSERGDIRVLEPHASHNWVCHGQKDNTLPVSQTTHGQVHSEQRTQRWKIMRSGLSFVTSWLWDLAPSLCLGCVSQNGTCDTLKTQHGRPHGLMVAMCSSRKSELYLRNTINI